jgi:hypothetical protein
MRPRETREDKKPGDIVRVGLRDGFNLEVAVGGDGAVRPRRLAAGTRRRLVNPQRRHRAT